MTCLFLPQSTSILFCVCHITTPLYYSFTPTPLVVTINTFKDLIGFQVDKDSISTSELESADLFLPHRSFTFNGNQMTLTLTFGHLFVLIRRIVFRNYKGYHKLSIVIKVNISFRFTLIKSLIQVC